MADNEVGGATGTGDGDVMLRFAPAAMVSHDLTLLVLIIQFGVMLPTTTTTYYYYHHPPLSGGGAYEARDDTTRGM